MPPPALTGSYTPPRVRVGQSVRGRYRDAECRVTGFCDAPIRWPLAKVVGKRDGRAGPLVDGEMERVIRTESAVALAHRFGVDGGTARRWRQWPGVAGHATTPGTREEARGAAVKRAAGGGGRRPAAPPAGRPVGPTTSSVRSARRRGPPG